MVISEPTAANAHLPLVTVVVPVLDAAGEVGRLLDSLRGLDYPTDRLEVIVVDNGSSDGTEEVASRFPVRLLRELRTRGSYAARNRGLAEAAGGWVAFTDADCVASVSWLKTLLAPPLPDEVGAVAGEVIALELATPVQRLTERYGLMKHSVTLPHKALPCFSTANVAVRSEVLSSLGGFREDIRFFGDMDLAWRMQLQLGRTLLFRPEAVIYHRHRRSAADLWWHGWQHGRGVAFMKRTYPDLYKIDLGEQVGRLRMLVEAASRSLRRPPAGGARDRAFAPLFLTLWYLGMGAGFLAGPAAAKRTTHRSDEPSSAARRKGEARR